MDIVLLPVFKLILMIISIYTWIVVAYVVLSWLVAFGVVPTNNPTAQSVSAFLMRAVDPVLNQIRRIVPPVAGLDISAIILFPALYFLEDVVSLLGAKLLRLLG